VRASDFAEITTMNIAQSPSTGASHGTAIAWSELLSHRAYLVRFAQRRLRDGAQAEDAVHDVFEAVLSGRASFGGRSALRSWLTAILKHKIVDMMRRDGRYDSLDEDASDRDATPCPLPLPEERVAQRLLLASTLRRIDALPAGLRDAMRFRVLEEQSTEAACTALGISEDNLFVRLHRARKQLLS
jgi:RNA polymerase sigma-70 factor, ECF subfamily